MHSPTSILVVDDEPDLLSNICLPLEAEGYRVFTAMNGEEALELLQDNAIQLILSDIAMPDMNGYQLFEKVRQNPAWIMIPFIFFSARSLDTDIHYGKELGVDDYLTKPIRGRHLLAVVRGKLRRAQQLIDSLDQLETNEADKNDDELRFGSIKIDSRQHRVWLDEQEIKLSVREFALLKELVRADGTIASPPQLIKATHDLETDTQEASNLVRPLILSLRRKLGISENAIGWIENVRGLGYRLVTAV